MAAAVAAEVVHQAKAAAAHQAKARTIPGRRGGRARAARGLARRVQAALALALVHPDRVDREVPGQVGRGQEAAAQAPAAAAESSRGKWQRPAQTVAPMAITEPADRPVLSAIR